MQVLCGMSEMAGLGDLYESPELTQFHIRLDYGPSQTAQVVNRADGRCIARPYMCIRDRARGPVPLTVGD
jgi:hypothetical protein